MLPPLSTTGLVMPDDFPIEPYECIQKQAVKHAGDPKFPFNRFANGWNAVSYRFLAAVDYESSFRSSFPTDGSQPNHPAMYQQERVLFGFFYSSTSIVETAIFAFFPIWCISGPSKILNWNASEGKEHNDTDYKNSIQDGIS